jgi:hypothetical protein
MRRRMMLAAALLAVAGLVACGGGEPAQRKAFIEFLQSRIIDKPGIHVPHLTADETSAFGDYAKQYAIITDFNAAVDQRITAPLQEALSKGVPSSIGEAVARRNDIAAVRDGMAKIRAALSEQLAVADAAHAALKQPDDLKPVFDAAYNRDVTQPAKAFAGYFPDLDAAFGAMLAIADFINQHRDSVKVNGPMIETADDGLRTQLQGLMDALSAKQDAVNAAQRKLAAMTGG